MLSDWEIVQRNIILVIRASEKMKRKKIVMSDRPFESLNIISDRMIYVHGQIKKMMG